MSAANAIKDHVIVDGSNLATEGRTLPSLAQLDEAVRAFLDEYPRTRITAIVDATFGHRIAASEKDAYEQAVLDGDLVAPPAGAIGRGDAFVLAIAHKAEATILSNDSFQEFHGEYDWLFDEGRLIGGKPVDGVGWVFVGRVPVRGPASRRSQRGARDPKAKLSKTDKAKEAAAVEAEVAARRGNVVGADKPARSRRRGGTPKANEPPSTKVPAAKAKTADTTDRAASTGRGRRAAAPDAPSDGGEEGGGRGRRRRSPAKAADAINESGPFVEFISTHAVGSEVTAVVDRFSSHGAYVVVGDAQCYVPLRAMADPPPRSAREVLTVGESRIFVVASFDAPRRSIDLALPGHQVTGDSVSEPITTQEALQMATAKKSATKKSAAKKAPAKKAPAKKSAAKKAPAKKAPAKKSAASKAPAKKAPAKKSAASKAPAQKSAAKKSAAKKSAAKKTPAQKSAAKKSPAKKATAKKATAKKAAAKKAPAKKRG
ncbi:histone H1-like repetitive region-containing protein [Iamia sp.]|uniref:histone H1-like repetitive region-containing protein n=1 Tax=Iamia sp. TaxID=2722710 RepID=UPI002CB10700|nr:histone H1-like repetitive region-containing protein [Iamia sp.]HXH56871.1 histone H1-like repetitive region-containing protein [Iamia sp.]